MRRVSAGSCVTDVLASSVPVKAGRCLTGRVRGAIAAILVTATSLLLAANASAEAAVHFNVAEHSAQRDVDSADAPTFRSDPGTPWRRVDLPHVVRGDPTTADRAVSWYRFRVRASDFAQEAGLYISRARWPRVGGRFDIYVNGEHIESAEIVWNRPLLIALPKRAIAGRPDGAIELAIAISAPRNSGAALSTIWLGPLDELRTRSAWRRFLSVQAPQALSLSALVLGLCALAFWRRSRSESAYLLFALMAIVYFVRNLHLYVFDPARLNDWFWWLTVNSLGWSMVLAHLFAYRLHGQRFARTERGLTLSILLISVISLICVALRVRSELWGPITYVIQVASSLLVTASSTFGAWRSRAPGAIVLAIVLWITVALGVHDWLLQNWRSSLDGVYLLPYGSILLVALFLVHALGRYMAAIRGAEGANTLLEQRLSERTRELELSHLRLRAIEREQTVLDERQRLMREMHDGLGSSLMSSLVLVEQGELDRAAVASVLRESIDDLKLTIDSLEPMADDLPTLLGTLRYRLGKRLEAAGLTLEWRVHETSRLAWLNPTAALQILRILQEALTNILKHAHASIIRVETGEESDQVFVRLTDNGRGFDVANAECCASGRGLQNLKRRALTLGGHVHIRSTPGATIVTLFLPVMRAQQN